MGCRREEGAVPHKILADLANRVANDRKLQLAVESVCDGGPGAGVDGISPYDLDHRDCMQLDVSPFADSSASQQKRRRHRGVAEGTAGPQVPEGEDRAWSE